MEEIISHVKFLIKKTIVKNILSVLAVPAIGFLLLNIAFILDFLFQSAVIWIIRLFTSDNPSMDWGWFPPMMHILFVGIIGLISWIVFRSKIGALFKAIYLTVPLAVIFVTFGMFFYRWPAVPFSLGSLFIIGVLHYLHRTKQSWIYYYTLILMGLVMAITGLLGVEI
jgi:hypothetical protein